MHKEEEKGEDYCYKIHMNIDPAKKRGTKEYIFHKKEFELEYKPC